MNTISELMTHDHRDCDGIFVRAEELASDGDWAEAADALKQFADALNAHFDAEESTLFPAFEQATGMTQGPTAVMRSEHRNMRDTLAALQYALDKQDADDFAGEAETLLIMMQQHNMKEESVIYPMLDTRLSGEEQQRLSDSVGKHLTEARAA
ncbi:hemerythrin domain-containing protein [Thauera sp.]|jgi:hemerythrin-like domain-containing protein|uniref:hemerythrin domain-containing protein n=1 Tax=Thauera sp. TaxID=1905334 RepID=UPI0026271871|nr:hemerythrin domain-containing protein [Thauera sp.]MCK6408586.1 hemerythrin domain-containing protein [Thauera sp.]